MMDVSKVSTIGHALTVADSDVGIVAQQVQDRVIGAQLELSLQLPYKDHKQRVSTLTLLTGLSVMVEMNMHV
jgi:hypothetical protein